MVKIINDLDEVVSYLGVELRDLVMRVYDLIRLVDPVDKLVQDNKPLLYICLLMPS